MAEGSKWNCPGSQGKAGINPWSLGAVPLVCVDNPRPQGPVWTTLPVMMGTSKWLLWSMSSSNTPNRYISPLWSSVDLQAFYQRFFICLWGDSWHRQFQAACQIRWVTPYPVSQSPGLPSHDQWRLQLKSLDMSFLGVKWEEVCPSV